MRLHRRLREQQTNRPSSVHLSKPRVVLLSHAATGSKKSSSTWTALPVDVALTLTNPVPLSHTIPGISSKAFVDAMMETVTAVAGPASGYERFQEAWGNCSSTHCYVGGTSFPRRNSEKHISLQRKASELHTNPFA